MLTRLQVSGFKNLIDVDVRFGPFTCIAGRNGVGKSNLFDAIAFLRALADRTVTEAALSVRDQGRRASDLRAIFSRSGTEYASEMSFGAEMIIPAQGVDDLGQTAHAAITFVRYDLVLGFRPESDAASGGAIEIRREELRHIPRGDAFKHLLFDHSATKWRNSVVTGRRFGTAFISTDTDGVQPMIRMHSDSGSDSGGRPLSRAASFLPRTVLSVSNAAESRTALLAKKEMQSWNLLQLEPSALRRPDEFHAETRVGPDGSHLPATLYHLANRAGNEADAYATYAKVANRLSELIDDIKEIRVERDERRELFTLFATDGANTPHPARSLSDGTLRFLALAVLEMEPSASGLICLEEPENGIHPERIPAMLRLLQDIAVDPKYPNGADNPLRQVIINTHSPVVVAHVPDDSLLVAESVHGTHGRVAFRPLPNTWRAKAEDPSGVASKGDLLTYLNPFGEPEPIRKGAKNTRRVKDRPDLQLMMPGPWATN